MKSVILDMIQSFVKENKLNAIICSILFWVLITACFTGNGAVMAALPAPWSKYGAVLTGMIATFFITWLFVKFDKSSLKEIGLVWERATIVRFIKGLLIGLGIFALMMIALVSVGKLQLKNNPAPFTWSTVPVFMFVLLPAFGEEVMFRSYTFINLNNALGLWGAQLIVAIAFALSHIVGGWGVYSAFMGPGIWAFVFGLAAVWSGGIAVPTGIHFALNILQQLTGMKGTEHAIFTISLEPGASAAQTEHVGIVLHLAVLIGSIVLTGWYIRNKNKVPAT